MKTKIQTPIVIPSFYKSGRNTTIGKCLDSIHKNYENLEIYVVAQKYPRDVLESLRRFYPKVEFIDIEEGFFEGIVGAFQYCHDYMSSRFPYYIFIEDDVKMLNTKGIHNPVLLAFEEVLKNRKVGIVGTLPKNLQRVKVKDPEKFVRYSGNPAHIIGYNSEATKNVVLDNKFKNYRTDTDITLQVVSQNFGLVLFTDVFTYQHMNPISKLNKETRKYEIISGNENSTNKRSETSWEETEVLLAEKWGLKINKAGRALYEQYVRDHNPFNKRNKLKRLEKLDIIKLWKMKEI